MPLASNSYSSESEVLALTRHLLDGEAIFNANTRPTLGDLHKFINYASSVLNSALAKVGFSTPVTQATVLYALNAWVTSKAAAWVEVTQRGAGFSDDGNSRVDILSNLMADAHEFVDMNMQGWQELGAGFTSTASDGVSFTGIDKHSERSDPKNKTREQPLFGRRQFDRSGPA